MSTIEQKRAFDIEPESSALIMHHTETGQSVDRPTVCLYHCRLVCLQQEPYTMWANKCCSTVQVLRSALHLLVQNVYKYYFYGTHPNVTFSYLRQNDKCTRSVETHTN